MWLSLLALVVLLGILWHQRVTPPAVHTLHGQAMGCRWTLAWRGEGPTAETLRREVAATLETWEQVLSTWREDSDLSRYNQGEVPTPALARVLALAETFHTASGGAFDHRLLASVHAAGFGPPGTGYDLSALGKGFAADRVGERLRALGVSDFLIEIGGDLLAGDGDWPVILEAPALPGAVPSPEPPRRIVLRRQGLATSGNYRQFSHITTAGEVASHLLDPRTGRPVLRPPCAVSVTASDAATADAWATACFVLGPDAPALPAGVEVRWSFARDFPRESP